MVLATFCNAAFKGMVLNFAAHLRNARIPHVVGAVDAEAFALMQQAGSPTYLIDIGHLDGSSSHSGASWKKFAVTRTGEVMKIVEQGFAVIMTDVDVLWLRDPRPYLHACDPSLHEKERASCSQLLAADVMASSDNLSPGKNLREGLADAYWGVFNTGIVVIRPTEAGKAFARKWHAYITDGPGEFKGLTSDQMVFNRLVRQGGAPPMSQMSGKWTVKRDGFQLGTLPTMFFCNGHDYFVRRMETSYDNVRPYAAHATYTYDGSSAAAKEQRFRDVGHWALPEPPENSQGTFLVAGSPDVRAAMPHGELGLGAHLDGLRAQLRSLRDALALAQALGRTLVLPHFTCFSDRVWAGHDNVFLFQHMYPGAQADGNYMPFECPVDHVLQLSAWRRMGVAYRDARFAESGGALDGAVLAVVKPPGGERVPGATAIVELPSKPLTDMEALDLLGPTSPAGAAKVLKVLPTAGSVFCTFADESARAAFDKRFAALIGAIEPWCSECHGSIAYAACSRADLEALAKAAGHALVRGEGPSALSLDSLSGAESPGVMLDVERVPRRKDFWRDAPRDTVMLRVSVTGKSTTDVEGVASPSVVFDDAPAALWAELKSKHSRRKYSKCSDFIPPDVLALGKAHVVASRDGGKGTQFCVPYANLLPPPLANTRPGGCEPPGAAQ